MHNSDTPAGLQAAPAKLPEYDIANWLGASGLTLYAAAASGEDAPALVRVYASASGFHFYYSLLPAQARQLAVYLVDCANALDNPADRVIVDEVERACRTCKHINAIEPCCTCAGLDEGYPTNWEPRHG